VYKVINWFFETRLGNVCGLLLLPIIVALLLITSLAVGESVFEWIRSCHS